MITTVSDSPARNTAKDIAPFSQPFFACFENHYNLELPLFLEATHAPFALDRTLVATSQTPSVINLIKHNTMFNHLRHTLWPTYVVGSDQKSDNLVVMSSATQTSPLGPFLQRLPAELRNSVYRFALVQDTRIPVDHQQGLAEPGLLTVCKAVSMASAPQ